VGIRARYWGAGTGRGARTRLGGGGQQSLVSNSGGGFKEIHQPHLWISLGTKGKNSPSLPVGIGRTPQTRDATPKEELYGVVSLSGGTL